MSYIDVAIPLVVGLLLVIRPRLFVKRGDPRMPESEQTRKFRKIGLVLPGVAAMYFVIRLSERGL